MGYFAVSDSQYIELTEEQLQMCWKLRGVYYCEQAYLMISNEIKSCEVAIYFEMSEEVKIANCDFCYMQNKEYPPKILDTGDQFVLSNLLQPWILMCEKSQKPFAIPYLTYHMINHTELCECSLTVAYEYQINKAHLQCSLDDQPSDDFVTYLMHNQAILDVLKHSHDIDVSNQLGRQIGMLTEDIPQFNLPELQWYWVTDDDVPHVYNNASNVVDVELTKFLSDVAQGINDYMYTNIAEWMIAQCQFWTYMRDAEWWQQVQFVLAILRALCWIVAILICCCYKCMIIATILGSQKVEDFDLIKTVPTKAHSAPMLPPHMEQILTLFPPEANHKNAPMNPQQIMSMFSVLIMVVLILVVIIVFLWKCFRFASNILRSCFPWFPYSTYHRGITKADIFVEVTRVNGAKSTWAHFMQICCHPTLLKRTGYLNSTDITIVKHCCMMRGGYANQLAKHADTRPYEHCFTFTKFRQGLVLVFKQLI